MEPEREEPLNIADTLDLLSTDNAQNMIIENITIGDIKQIRARIDELDEFLTINDGSAKVKEITESADEAEPEDKDDEDGNNTDDLLQMLGEDLKKTTKYLIKTVKKTKLVDLANDDSTEDELESAIKTYKIPKQQPVQSVKARQDNNNSPVVKSSNKPSVSCSKSSKSKVTKSLVPATKKTFPIKANVKNYSLDLVETQRTMAPKAYVAKPKLVAAASEKTEDSCDEDIKEEEFLDEDCFDLEDNIGSAGDVEESDEELEKQTRRVPETMEEEVPSDEESGESDLSLFGDLPSTDTSDAEDWFELDIRNETAADYIPLLADKAEAYLTKEKQRIKATIGNLKQHLDTIVSDIEMQVGKIADEKLKIIEIDSLLHKK